nr:hypothetical protein [Micromonospora provocatoris]
MTSRSPGNRSRTAANSFARSPPPTTTAPWEASASVRETTIFGVRRQIGANARSCGWSEIDSTCGQ